MEKEKVLSYLQNLCVKRECCSSDILKKAEKALEGDRAEAQRMLEALVADRFVDDARYAAAFAREKSSLTGWGPDKIRYALLMKGISKPDIAAALEEIDPETAGARLEKLVAAKCKTLQGDPFIKFKLIKYALSRGYRYDDVGPVVEKILSGLSF
ncbi:MAG: RecX family transcriptional regulator [Bacteroidales bacterium]|nr:RecX family transcriptional regulator [Bacteroidales bacterium]